MSHHGADVIDAVFDVDKAVDRGVGHQAHRQGLLAQRVFGMNDRRAVAIVGAGRERK